MSKLLVFLSKSLIHSFADKKEWFAQICWPKPFFLVRFLYVLCFTSDSLIPSFLMSDVSKLLRLLTKNERCEQIAQVTHQKWATMSHLPRLLTKNERITLLCSKSLICSFFRKKRAIRSENWWANSQPWKKQNKIY